MSDPNKNSKIIIKTLTDIKAETMPSKTNLLTYNNILRHNIKQAKQLYYRDFSITYKNNNKKTWNGIEEVMGKYHKAKNYPELFNYNIKKLKNKQDIVNNLNDFFINLGPTLASKI